MNTQMCTTRFQHPPVYVPVTGKQVTEQDELQVLLMTVVPTFLRLGSSIYWEANNEARTKIGVAYRRGINTSKPHLIQ